MVARCLPPPTGLSLPISSANALPYEPWGLDQGRAGHGKKSNKCLETMCVTTTQAVDVTFPPLARSAPVLGVSETYTAPSGGSLGSCVDEERSKLRDLM